MNIDLAALDAIERARPALPDLPADVAARLDRALDEARAALAARALAASLDPARTRSTWELARDLARRIKRWDGIRRPPRDTVERLLATIATGTARRSPRRFADWL